MRRLVALAAALLVCSVAGAKPFVSEGPPVRKPAPRDLSDEVLQAYVSAIVSDKAGDLEGAVRRYQDATHKQPLAVVFYNLGDVYRRMEKIEKAIQSYQKYVELAPDAADRKQVEALIDALAKAEFVAVIDGDDADGVVFLDGKLLGASPQVVKLPAGEYAADRITPAGYRHREFKAVLGKTEHVRIGSSYDSHAKPPGNVIIALSANFGTSGGWTDPTTNVKFEANQRFHLDPGHYATRLLGNKSMCGPLDFTVPEMGADEVFYLWVDTPPRARGETSCIKTTTRGQRVAVPVQTKSEKP